MIYAKKTKYLKPAVTEIKVSGYDADSLFQLLLRIYTNMQGIDVNCYVELPKGILIYEDELEVITKMIK